MKRLSKTIEASVFGAMAFALFFHNGAEYWHAQWAIAQLFLGTSLCAVVLMELGVFPALCLFWTIASAIWAIEYSGYQRIQPALGTLLSVEGVAGYGLASFLLVVFGVFLIPKNQFLKVKPVIAGACLLASLHVILQLCLGRKEQYLSGFCDQASMAGCFIATTFPLYASHILAVDMRGVIRVILISLPPIATTLLLRIAGASVPTLVLLGVIASAAVFDYGLSWKKIVFLGLLATGVLAASRAVNPLFFDSSGRFDMYVLTWQYWREHANPLTGIGNSLFFMLGSQIQKTHENGWFGWLHSDWGQLLFEQGVIGLLLYAGLFVDCLRRAIRAYNFDLASALTGYAISALFNFPVRFAAHAILGAVLVRLAIAGVDRSPFSKGGLQCSDLALV